MPNSGGAYARVSHEERSTGAHKDVDKTHVIPFLRRLARRNACARRQVGDVRGHGGWHIVSSSVSRVNPAKPRTNNSDLSERGGATAVRSVAFAGSPSANVSSASWACELVQYALTEGLIERDGDVVRLTSSGAAFLRRSHAKVEDAYAEQHQVRSVRPVSGNEHVTVNECESPLGWLRNRKDRRTGKPLISQHQFDAGERLRQDYFKAQMSARVTADWSCALSGGRSRRTSGDDRVDLTDAAIAAKSRFYKALGGVGEELSEVLVWVCCEGKGLRDVEQTAGWPQRSGKLMLQMALRALARYYGLEPSRHHAASSWGGVSHWGADDYRPRLDEEDLI